MNLVLKDNEPIYQRARRLSLHDKTEVVLNLASDYAKGLYSLPFPSMQVQ